MPTTTTQSLESVERHRAKLEETVASLSKALEHWATWESEYETLKRELQAAGSPSPPQMVELARNMGGTLVTVKEVEELLGKDLQTKRTANQVIDMITRRLDYVRQNLATIDKQFEKTEKQLAGLALLSDPGLENEEGLPMMDIEEELDEDENVISSSVSQPGKAPPELMDALRKARLHKNESTPELGSEESEKATESREVTGTSSVLPPASSTPASTLKSTVPAETSQPKPDGKPKVDKAAAPKKSVSFANDVQIETFHQPKTLRDDLQNWNLKPGSKVYELDAEGDNVLAEAVMPEDEDDDDRALRREMIEYGLSEINQVVAQLDIADGDSMDDDDYDYDYDSDEDSEEEDKFGRSTRRYLDDDYLQQMRDLEQKLNARMMENVGPDLDETTAQNVKDVRTLRVRKDDDYEQSMTTSFAEPVDNMPREKAARLANDTEAGDATQIITNPEAPVVSASTLSDAILEHTSSPSQPLAGTSKSGKTSRFKASRASNNQPPAALPTPSLPESQPISTGSSDHILADNVTEHAAHASKPKAPDDFDAVANNREILNEYHRHRNRMIQQGGGFAAPAKEDEDEDAFVEERNGKMKKVSRFKAARLKAEGL